jgi:PAS domain S-box-containing protein
MLFYYGLDDGMNIPPRLLQYAVDHSNDGIVIAEQEGDEHILIYVNQGFERLTGYHAEEILYQDCRFLQRDDRDQPGLTLIREALAQDRACRTVLRNYRKDGSLFLNELSITPVFFAEDNLMYYIGVQKDVSHLPPSLLPLDGKGQSVTHLEILKK